MAQTINEFDMRDLFDNFSPNARVQMDFAKRDGENFLVIVDQMSGFLQIINE